MTIGEVRRVQAADLDAASAVLADAFADYPWTRWTVAGDRHAERIGGLQRLFMDRIALPYGDVWLACDEHADPISVAIWMRPDSDVPAAANDSIRAPQAALEGARHAAATEAEAFILHLKPSTPHYYLGACGTRGDRQRQGFGAAVLRPVLDRADREGVPAFLETSAVENVAFYSVLGFVVTGEVDIPGGGPHVWAMTRRCVSDPHDVWV